MGSKGCAEAHAFDINHARKAPGPAPTVNTPLRPDGHVNQEGSGACRFVCFDGRGLVGQHPVGTDQLRPQLAP